MVPGEERQETVNYITKNLGTIGGKNQVNIIAMFDLIFCKIQSAIFNF